MSDMMLRGVGFPLIFAAIVTLLLAWRRHRRARPVTRCTGPRGLSAVLNPIGWFWRCGCHYDLTALGTDEAGHVRCPECARVLHPSRGVRTAYRFRAWRGGVAMLLVGISMCVTPAFRTGRWTAMLPTMALVVTEHIDPEPSTRLQRELEARFNDDGVRSWEAGALIKARIADLRDDDVAHNAREAVEFLIQRERQATPALEAALLSDDFQQRQLAAYVLRQFPTYTPGDELLQVTLERLRHYRQPNLGYHARYTREAEQYLARHPFAAREHLERGLESDDTRQRRLSALIVIRCCFTPLYDRAVQVLAEHLRDNDTPRDARHTRGVLGDGDPDLIPLLRPYLDSDDEQQRRYVKDVIEALSRRSGVGATPPTLP